ncbi:hypothetical protein QFZ51_000311 [Chitinophaga sp. W3I9]|uniref:lipopolysaccharide biosynthesis protein n=1 Tax=unclassified Chitinophaga TaxID=2619133 RepID=UPI0035252354
MEISNINTNVSDKNNDEISVRELVIKLGIWWKYFLKNWYIILLFGILGGATGLILSFILKTKYVAELTFVVEDNSGSPLGAYAGLASQFGIDLGGSGSNGVFQGDNIMTFLKSRLMIEKALLSTVMINGKKQTLAERYIDFNELRLGWAAKPSLKGISFPPGGDRRRFSLLQDSILQTLQESIGKSVLKVEKVDKKLNFIVVRSTTRDELFAKAFTERLMTEATNFYIDTRTQRSKTNVDRLQAEADSLEKMLNRKTYSVALAQDINMNPARQVASINTQLASRDKMVLETMYGEVVKNLELGKIAMAQETPIIQVIDTPILPLKKEKLGKTKGVIIGGLMGGFFIVIFLTLRKVLKDILA